MFDSHLSSPSGSSHKYLHDVTIAYDYTSALLSSDLFFWTESVLLYAFLADNPRFEIGFRCAMLHDAALERVQEIIPTYDAPMKAEGGLTVGDPVGVLPSSMWLEVVAEPEDENYGPW
jgi:hypothetical protein